jgi:DNA-directed RNA polymerase specialized sigma24 family protein
VAVLDAQKLDEVAGVVCATYVQRGVPNRDDLYQDAALAALETWERYGDRIKGNPFTYLAGAAFRRTKLASVRARSVVSVSEAAAGGRTKDELVIAAPVSLFTCRRQKDGRREERYAAVDERPEILLAGELTRLQAVVRLLRRLDRKEIRLITIAMEPAPQVSLRKLAGRSKLSCRRARSVIRSFVRAVGPDPVVEHLRCVISRP